MQKAIAMILAMAMSVSLWGDQQSAERHEKGHPTAEDLRVPDSITPTSRDPETWYLYIEDTYGDGWGGSSLTLTVNDVEFGVYTLTADEGDDSDGDGYIDDNYAIYEVEVDDWTFLHAVFAVNDNGWPSECIYAYYDADGLLVDFENGGPDLNHTVDQADRMSVMQNGGYEGGMGGWGAYPNQSLDVLTTGDGMYNSDETFTAYDGNKSFKMWGLYWDGDPGTGWENQIHQEWGGDASWGHDEIPEAGTSFNLSAYLMSHNADFIGQGNSHAKLMVKYFGDGSGATSGKRTCTGLR